ncbi:bifunctional phosphopantothenoylcysteine decarboxylase/phosphopantothenate--cysteine ligase CoaBC [Rhodoluna sp.]|uniref:bifunctional phosphopantothenoylcysteine decarboxylase/phosphopantothenate--cysteine ligase CoaBC n=1 Tax=Rhodoluna sp. TaxID=1969481 RepID=UPI0025E72D92|nr:bifunctional phosphopantothenoylcysteine decarboxylase/phosphopantothenate--cysteine ligase CoaBC [Rhodoluna sp.]
MRIIVGVTGGIAAYKATSIIRQLTEAGHSVKVIPTANALRFIGATTLEALSHNTVDPDLYTDVDSVKHVALGQEADLVLVAPATAAFLGRYAAGIADDLLLNTLLVTKAPVVVAPAMHTEMWNHPSTQENVATLEERGVRVMVPAEGRLTGADYGIGRLPEPEEIVKFALANYPVSSLAGKHFVVTAGGTQEPIDPVRFIGNHSSGKQGIAIAREAKARGARVTLIAANLEDSNEFDAQLNVHTAAELQAAVAATLSEATVLVMTAAVSDFKVANGAEQKLKRAELFAEQSSIQITLEQNPDILADAVAQLAADNSKCITVGFAAETAGGEALEKFAQHKLASKGCHILVANDVSNGAVFGAETNDTLILTKSGRAVSAKGSKALVAAELLDVIESELA